MGSVETERKKILDGSYSSRVIRGKQRKHIEGTREFEQNRLKMQQISSGSEPSILNVDAQELVDNYKGKGTVKRHRGSLYPSEIIDADMIIGKTWVKSKRMYVETKRAMIVYSSDGVHVVPISDYKKR